MSRRKTTVYESEIVTAPRNALNSPGPGGISPPAPWPKATDKLARLPTNDCVSVWAESVAQPVEIASGRRTATTMLSPPDSQLTLPSVQLLIVQTRDNPVPSTSLMLP